jgi:ATP-dependent exoDNAse (exonuclease V) beta subunit
MTAVALGDAGARSRIAEDLDANLVVIAGAGTGKTTALVGRIVELVRSGTPLREIAAITFTEAAAAELRERIRAALEGATTDGNDAMSAARHEVDEASIGTLHSFAQRILLEQCVDAGLPPNFEVLDDTADTADFEVRWAQFADRLFDEPDAGPALTLGFALGLRPTDLAAIAWNLHAHWDRLEDGGLHYLGAAPRCDDHWPATDARPVITALDLALSSMKWCTDDDDKMVAHLAGVVDDARTLLIEAGPDTYAVLQLLTTLPPFRCAHGRQENWSGHIGEVRARCAEAEQIRNDLLDEVRRAVLGDLVARLAVFTLGAAEERRLEGRLTFHDLLVHARRLVRQGGECLALLQRRYRRLLIDEFQDTDPLQVELAARLVAATEGGADLSQAGPGTMFVVGDPKQSIYRFRRADIEIFDDVATAVGTTVVLQTNFRSVPGVVDFVNVVFEKIFGAGGPGQAAHHALEPARPAAGGAGPDTSAAGGGPDSAGPVQLSFDALLGDEPPPPARARPAPARSGARPLAPVVVTGGPLPASMPEVRRCASSDAAAAITTMVGQGWMVEDVDRGTQRATRWADIAVLIPARSALPALEEAFEDVGVPYRLEGAALLWGAEEVREVLAVLRATDDPADSVAVLGALRSPGLACGDDDLVTWHQGHGTWDPRAPAPPGLEDHPVAVAMAVLDRLHGRLWWCEPSALVAATYEELRSFDLALVHRRPRDYWHRLRWLQDQARLFDEAPGGTLRAFLAWAGLRAEGDGRVGGVGPPDPDDDAVRVMTIHGAKGLEFPVVVLAGLERDQADAPRPPAVVWTEDNVPEIHVGPFRSAGFEQAGLREQHLDLLEQHRLLYVGMTRARDHLVLCLHHKQRQGASDSSLAALVARICADNPTLSRRLPDIGPLDTRPPDSGPVRRPAPAATPLPPTWEADRSRLLAAHRRRPVTTATAVAQHPATSEMSLPGGRRPADPGWPESPLVEWDHPDTARRIGRAVHAALADLDLATHRDATGRSADDVARERAMAQGVPAHEEEVAALVGGALTSPTVLTAASRRSWRELYVVTPIDNGGVLEGFVDLVYEDDDGLVIVDYKTDRHHGDGPADTAGHRLQVAAYAVALEASTGRRVHRCVLVFVADGEPWEQAFEGDDLADAMAEARRIADALVAP